MTGPRAPLHVGPGGGGARAGLALVVAAATACSAISTVRVQPENVAVSPGLRPVAAIQVNATSAYFLFIPIPGGVDLDRIVNRMLIVTAKMLGADKVANLQFDITPDSGIWTLRKLLGWRSAQASGIAVQVEAPADPDADRGPEPAAPSVAAPSPAAP